LGKPCGQPPVGRGSARLPVNIYCTAYQNPNTAELVRTFGLYVVSDEGQQTAADAAKSSPMPANLADQAQAAIESITAT
jgi:phosphate transport system substrate-binding protein